tara:strand:+ start:470 stop:709 length:240 start_codon:yes stop_codon:yes gene_type:complete
MINDTKLIEAMQANIVYIKYMCPVTSEEKEREVTTSPQFTQGVDIPHLIVNDKFICYDVEFNKWHEIPIESVLKWKKLT